MQVFYTGVLCRRSAFSAGFVSELNLNNYYGFPTVLHLYSDVNVLD